MQAFLFAIFKEIKINVIDTEPYIKNYLHNIILFDAVFAAGAMHLKIACKNNLLYLYYIIFK